MENVSVKNIHKSLNKEGYICDVDFAALVTSAIKSKPVGGAFLYGPAGTGKSYLPMVLSKVLNLDMFFFQCSAGTREDDLVLKMIPSENTKSGVEIKKSTVYQAAEASLSGEVLLVLDEWDKTRPTADGFFLDFLQYGRLSIPGSKVMANLDNMTIFFTANDERDFHEALLRRFPKIDINPLKPSLVLSALRKTHDNHPHLDSSIKLYETAVMSGMTKPATIQEIRQLLDAITLLGNGSDWNSLVYQYITKTPENHELLRKAQGTTYSKNSEVAKINHEDFEGSSVLEDDEAKSKKLMPTISKNIIGDCSVENDSEFSPEEDEYAVFEYTENNYSSIAHISMDEDGGRSESAINLGQFKVYRDKISTMSPVPLTDCLKFASQSSGRGSFKGEIAFVDKRCTAKDLKSIPDWDKYIIHKSSRDEIVARYEKIDKSQNNKSYLIDLCWKRGEGLILIFCSTDFITIFDGMDGMNRSGPKSSLNIVSPLTRSLLSPLILISSSRGLKSEKAGILNIKQMVEHAGEIKYSFPINDIDFMDSLAEISKNVYDTSGGFLFSGDGYEVEIFKNHYLMSDAVSIRIWKAPPPEAIECIIRIMYSANFSSYFSDSMPIYFGVEANANKVSKYFSKRGWSPGYSGMRKFLWKKYKGFFDAECRLYLLENVVIFAFEFTLKMCSFDGARSSFSRGMRIVKRLAEKAVEIGE